MTQTLERPAAPAERPDRNPFAGEQYRWWWAITFTTALGTGAQLVTVPTYVLDRTDTRFMVAVAVLCQTVPTALFTLVGGAWADRFGRRVILRVTQLITAAAAASLLLLSATGVEAVWPVLPIAAVIGTSWAFQNPARQSLIGVLAPGSRLQNGVIWGTLAMMGGNSLLGPALGGAIVSAYGLTAGFGAAVVLLLIGSWCTTRLGDVPATVAASTGLLTQIRAGLGYVFREPRLWQVLVLGAVPGLCFIGVSQAVLPVYARDTFDRGADGIALLNAGMGVGTLTGSILLARLGPRHRRGRWFLAALPLGGAAFLLGGLAPTIALAAAVFVVWGLSASLFINYAATFLQTYADPRYLGRVMSIYSLCIMGAVPLGNLHAGLSLQRWGPRPAIVYAGLLAAMIGWLAIAALRNVRRLD
jgi:MFS family permease